MVNDKAKVSNRGTSASTGLTNLIGNTTETLNSIDLDVCNPQRENFVRLHIREIARLTQSSSKTLRWFVA